jgi:hypothetical protein
MAFSVIPPTGPVIESCPVWPIIESGDCGPINSISTLPGTMNAPVATSIGPVLIGCDIGDISTTSGCAALARTEVTVYPVLLNVKEVPCASIVVTQT